MTLPLEEVQRNPNYSRQQRFILNVCIICWVGNHDEYNQFLLTIPYIAEALEVMSHKLRQEISRLT